MRRVSARPELPGLHDERIQKEILGRGYSVIQNGQFIEVNAKLLAVRDEIRGRCHNEFEPYSIIAPGATRKLLPLQQRDLVRKAVLVVMHSINAAFLDRLSGSEDEHRATRYRSRFARR
jgi:hypothetical protein